MKEIHSGGHWNPKAAEVIPAFLTRTQLWQERTDCPAHISETEWTAALTRLSEENLSDAVIMEVLERGFPQTDTGKATAGLWIDAIVRSLGAVPGLTAQQLRWGTEIVWRLPPSGWRAAFGLRTNDVLQQPRSGLLGHVQKHLQLLRAETDLAIARGELLSNDRMQILGDIYVDYAVDWQDAPLTFKEFLNSSFGPVNAALRDPPTLEAARTLLAELSKKLAQPVVGAPDGWMEQMRAKVTQAHASLEAAGKAPSPVLKKLEEAVAAARLAAGMPQNTKPSLREMLSQSPADKPAQSSLPRTFLDIDQRADFRHSVATNGLRWPDGPGGKFTYALNAWNGLGGTALAQVAFVYQTDVLPYSLHDSAAPALNTSEPDLQALQGDAIAAALRDHQNLLLLRDLEIRGEAKVTIGPDGLDIVFTQSGFGALIAYSDEAQASLAANVERSASEPPPTKGSENQSDRGFSTFLPRQGTSTVYPPTAPIGRQVHAQQDSMPISSPLQGYSGRQTQWPNGVSGTAAFSPEHDVLKPSNIKLKHFSPSDYEACVETPEGAIDCTGEEIDVAIKPPPSQSPLPGGWFPGAMAGVLPDPRGFQQASEVMMQDEAGRPRGGNAAERVSSGTSEANGPAITQQPESTQLGVMNGSTEEEPMLAQERSPMPENVTIDLPKTEADVDENVISILWRTPFGYHTLLREFRQQVKESDPDLEKNVEAYMKKVGVLDQVRGQFAHGELTDAEVVAQVIQILQKDNDATLNDLKQYNGDKENFLKIARQLREVIETTQIKIDKLESDRRGYLRSAATEREHLRNTILIKGRDGNMFVPYSKIYLIPRLNQWDLRARRAQQEIDTSLIDAIKNIDFEPNPDSSYAQAYASALLTQAGGAIGSNGSLKIPGALNYYGIAVPEDFQAARKLIGDMTGDLSALFPKFDKPYVKQVLQIASALNPYSETLRGRSLGEVRNALCADIKAFPQYTSDDNLLNDKTLLKLIAPALLVRGIPPDVKYLQSQSWFELEQAVELAKQLPPETAGAMGYSELINFRDVFLSKLSDTERAAFQNRISLRSTIELGISVGMIPRQSYDDYSAESLHGIISRVSAVMLGEAPDRRIIATDILIGLGMQPTEKQVTTYLDKGKSYSHPALNGITPPDPTSLYNLAFDQFDADNVQLYKTIFVKYVNNFAPEYRETLTQGTGEIYAAAWKYAPEPRSLEEFNKKESFRGPLGGIVHVKHNGQEWIFQLFPAKEFFFATKIDGGSFSVEIRGTQIRFLREIQYRTNGTLGSILPEHAAYEGRSTENGFPIGPGDDVILEGNFSSGTDNTQLLADTFAQKIMNSHGARLRDVHLRRTPAEQRTMLFEKKRQSMSDAEYFLKFFNIAVPFVACFNTKTGEDAGSCAADLLPGYGKVLKTVGKGAKALKFSSLARTAADSTTLIAGYRKSQASSSFFVNAMTKTDIVDQKPWKLFGRLRLKSSVLTQSMEKALAAKLEILEANGSTRMVIDGVSHRREKGVWRSIKNTDASETLTHVPCRISRGIDRPICKSSFVNGESAAPTPAPGSVDETKGYAPWFGDRFYAPAAARPGQTDELVVIDSAFYAVTNGELSKVTQDFQRFDLKSIDPVFKDKITATREFQKDIFLRIKIEGAVEDTDDMRRIGAVALNSIDGSKKYIVSEVNPDVYYHAVMPKDTDLNLPISMTKLDSNSPLGKELVTMYTGSLNANNLVRIHGEEIVERTLETMEKLAVKTGVSVETAPPQFVKVDTTNGQAALFDHDSRMIITKKHDDFPHWRRSKEASQETRELTADVFNTLFQTKVGDPLFIDARKTVNGKGVALKTDKTMRELRKIILAKTEVDMPAKNIAFLEVITTSSKDAPEQRIIFVSVSGDDNSAQYLPLFAKDPSKNEIVVDGVRYINIDHGQTFKATALGEENGRLIALPDTQIGHYRDSRPRSLDTESKLMQAMMRRYPDQTQVKSVTVATTMAPCESCSCIMKEYATESSADFSVIWRR